MSAGPEERAVRTLSLCDRYIAEGKLRVPTCVFQPEDGPTPLEGPGLEPWRTESVWKHGLEKSAIRYIDCLCMETFRDMNHTKLGLMSMVYGAEIAYNQGVDLFDAPTFVVIPQADRSRPLERGMNLGDGSSALQKAK